MPRPARLVRVIAWGLTETDADLAYKEAHDEAARCGWNPASVTRVIGGKASDATSAIPSLRILRASQDYGRAYTLTIDPAPRTPDDDACLQALTRWARHWR